MENFIVYFFVFFLGTCAGSFLNCVIYRLEKEKSFLTGRSFCPKCKHDLGFLDLIPILSFIFLAGRCRYCNKKISFQYPLIELITGILFLLTFHKILGSQDFTVFNILNFCYLLIFICFLIVIFVYDLKHYIIPDKVIYPAIIISIIYQIFHIFCFSSHTLYFSSLLNSFASAVLAAGFFLLIILISKGRWMGVGDVKLSFFMGMFLKSPAILVALFSAFLIGGIIGIILIIFKKKKLKDEIPFGPFLTTGTFISFFAGPQIIDFYFSLFL